MNKDWVTVVPVITYENGHYGGEWTFYVPDEKTAFKYLEWRIKDGTATFHPYNTSTSPREAR